MANQAIALQARAPQGNFLAPAIQQGAQMINMMRQQQALDRQTAVAQQQMEIQRAAEGRAARGEDIATRKANQEYTVAEVSRLRNRLPKVGSEAGWQMWLSEVEKVDSNEAAQLREFSPNYDPQKIPLVAMAADEYINKTIATPMASLQIGAGNKAFNTVVGGTNPGATPLTVAPAPNATPAPSAAAPPAPAPAAGGMFRPTAFSQEQGSVDPAAALVTALKDAQQSKRIDAGAVEQIKAMVPPQVVDQFIQANNIQVSPTNGMRSAVYRPGEDAAPQIQTVQAYNQPGSQFQVAKDPNISPMPGSASVPLPRVAAEARAGRETPEEVYAKEMAKNRAARDAGPKPLTAVQEAKLRDNITKDYKSARATIDMMLDPTSGVIATVNAVRNLTPDQKESVTGYSAYLPSVTASSKSADTKIKNLKGKVTEMGRAAATLTGAIGQMAVQEWRIVSDMIANLDVEGMDPKDLDDQLDIIESTARRAAATTQDAYTNQYAEEFERYPNRFQLKEPQKAENAKKTLRFDPATGGFK